MNDTPPPRGPRLFLDSAEVDCWRDLLPLGIFHGVTTNPLLLERAGRPCRVDHLHLMAGEAARLGAREIHLQSWGDGVEDLTATGLELAHAAEAGIGVVIKVPATADGFRAARCLQNEGIRVTLTAVYDRGQLLAGAAAGAAYAAPYLGRLDDAGRDGAAIVSAMHRILVRTGAATRLLVASLRSAGQVVALAEQGLDTFTFGPAVARALVTDDLTEKAARDFLEAAGSGPHGAARDG